MHETNRAHGRPWADILLEIKDELISFVETRVRMFTAEFEETARSLKSWIPLAITAVVLLGTGYLLLTAGLVSLVSFAFLNSPFRWPLAFLIVGGLWAVGGFVAAGLARNAFRSRVSFPKKTVETLKADGLWLHDEVQHTA